MFEIIMLFAFMLVALSQLIPEKVVTNRAPNKKKMGLTKSKKRGSKQRSIEHANEGLRTKSQNASYAQAA